MPTVLTWTYVGEHATVVDGDVQRIKAGEIGEDDALGDVTILSFEGGDLTIETGERDADGKLVQRKRTAGHIRAKVIQRARASRESCGNRPPRPAQGRHFSILWSCRRCSLTDTITKAKGQSCQGAGKGVH